MSTSTLRLARVTAAAIVIVTVAVLSWRDSTAIAVPRPTRPPTIVASSTRNDAANARGPLARVKPTLPSGKGMWIWEPEKCNGGDPVAIVQAAGYAGISHLFVRMGSSVDGFTAAEFLDALLPVAHAAGLKVIGWDFPYLDDVGADVDRAVAAIDYATPTGERIDGFAPDIETASEGVALSPEAVTTYGQLLRNRVGDDYPIVATVPRPSEARQAEYPYGEVMAWASAVAPMVYWIDTPPDFDVAQAVAFLAPYGKPIMPVGQAYDSGLEGGVPGTPTQDELRAFVNTADASGAKGVSFWSWQHATPDMWAVIAQSPDVGK